MVDIMLIVYMNASPPVLAFQAVRLYLAYEQRAPLNLPILVKFSFNCFAKIFE